jgi:hypothetical protein
MSTLVAKRLPRAAAVALFTLPFAVSFVAIACSPPKQADDPSTTSGTSNTSGESSGDEAAKKPEETPKWDSTSETQSAASSGSSSGSSGSSGSSSGSSRKEMAPPTTPSPVTGQRSKDVYDKEATEIVLARAARQVKANCGFAKDEDGNAKGPWGKTAVTVNLGHNGHIRGATIPAPFDGKPAGKCALQAFSTLTFPPWSGPDTSVDWPIEIAQPTK